MRKPDVAAYVAGVLHDCPEIVIVDPNGEVLLGEATPKVASCEIVAGGATLGMVRGPGATRVADMLSLLAAREAETRALARESLDRYRELTMLYAISEKIVGLRDAAGIAKAISGEAAHFLNCDGAVAWLINPESGRLEQAAAVGLFSQARSSRAIGNDIVAAVVSSGTGEIVNDVAADPRSIDLDADLRSIACSPLRSGERTFGVLLAATATPRDFSAGDLQLLNAMASQAAAALEVVRLDRDLRAASRKPVDVIYGIDERPPLGVSLMLGIQHVLIAVMSLAYPVLVTLEAGGSRLQAAAVVSMSLVAMAMATALQTLRWGLVGSGYLAPYITSAIYVGPSLLAARHGGLPLVFGMTLLSGVFAIGLSQVLRRFRRLFPPEVSGVVVLMVGISMVPVAIEQFAGVGVANTVATPQEWLVGLITLATILVFTVLAGRIRLYATAIGLTAGYASAAGFGLFEPSEFEAVRDLPLIGFQPVGFSGLDVAPLLLVPFLAAALASNVKDAGLLITAQRANDAGWKRPDTSSMGGGLVVSGLGNVAAGSLGGVGLGVSSGSVGLAVATGAMARTIGLVTAAIFLILAFLPQVTAVVALVPGPVMGAGLIYVACHLVTSGTELISSRMLDARRIYVVGLPLLAGVGLIAVPDLLAEAPAWSQAILASPLATATILALALNATLTLSVSSRASATVDLEGNVGSTISTLMDRQGAAWGARRDVVVRAAPAVAEWCEELRELAGVDAVSLELSFDEFTFAVAVRPSLSKPARRANVGDLGKRFERVARSIESTYDSTARLAQDHSVLFRFEH